MEQQQNSKNQQGQQNKMTSTGNSSQDVSKGATEGMPKAQNEKSTQQPSQGQSQFSQAGQENEQGSSNKGSVNMGQQRSGGQSQQTSSQNK